MRLITVIYGDKLLPMLWLHLQSVTRFYPFNPVSVLYEDISPSEIKVLKINFPNYEFIECFNRISEKNQREKISSKLIYWSIACDKYPNETLCMLDCDTVICANFSSLIQGNYDVLYPWKNEKFPINAGVMILKNKRKVQKFMKTWLELSNKILSNQELLQNALETTGGLNQQALFEILKTKNYNRVIRRKINGEFINFKGVLCKYLNETNCAPITKDTHIIHYKGGWQPILLEDKPFSENRPEDICREMYVYWQKLYKKAVTEFIRKFCLESALKYKDKFASILDSFEKHGILNSEMLAVCSVCDNLGVDIVIESGRCRGQSTQVLAEYFSGTRTKVISIEIKKDENAKYAEKKLQKYSKLELIYGDSKNIIHKILSEYPGKKIAILFDGPKGKEAIKIFEEAIQHFPSVKTGFFHDMRKSTIDMPNPNRKIMEDTFDRIFFTDDEEYVESFRYLDRGCLPDDSSITEDEGWRPWMKGSKRIGSYGLTLAVVLPVPKERLLKPKSDATSRRISKSGKFLNRIKSILKKILGKRISRFVSKGIKTTIRLLSYAKVRRQKK